MVSLIILRVLRRPLPRNGGIYPTRRPIKALISSPFTSSSSFSCPSSFSPPSIVFPSLYQPAQDLPLTTAVPGPLSEPLPPDKPYYVTTPIFYVNAEPHIGHLHTLVLADVLKRWSDLTRPRPCPPPLLGTGTDEHGIKVQKAAAAASIPPRELCDANSARFVELAGAASVAYDNFVRTSSEHHRRAVHAVWERLAAKDLIYKANKRGWYSVVDETFYDDIETYNDTDPTTGRSVRVARVSGNAVEHVEEDNYHFRLTAFKDSLLEHYNAHPSWIVPLERRTEMSSWLKTRLTDFSVSRPATRLQWGIPVPGDDSQTIYVWFDALVNYISQIGFPDWADADAMRAAGWPADVQVVGKDIQRFHCIYWPAMLMALDLPLPRRILSHPHWTVAGKKMSKSRGNVVAPLQAFERFGVDQLRYYMMRNGHAVNDTTFADRSLAVTINAELMSQIGNLFTRISAPSNGVWDLVTVIRTMSGGRWKDARLEIWDHPLRQLRTHLADEVASARESMDELRVAPALMHLINPRAALNRLLELARPWRLEPSDARDAIIYHVVDVLRITAILLQPFMPVKAALLLDRMGVDPGRRTVEWAQFDRDDGYSGTARPGTDGTSSLFVRIPRPYSLNGPATG